MSEEFWLKVVLAICTALPATVAALAALRQGKKNGRQAAITKAFAEATNAKTQQIKVIAEETSAKTEKIHDVTNSNFSKVTGELAAATQQIKDLQSLVGMLAEKQKTPNQS